ncbi:recQ-mediated genome instability protein 1-like [Culex pipiens pallens]|uniref:recQ-mediated genome instability protein 1-like n=1 Tax=Culex pipiens pallens TaxID=42434 RepID=UPI0019549398|nr:recQ-mediated genome instability protein 1-like [Culex pipiens pallens]
MIQSETTRAAQVKGRFLREYSIKVVDEWLTGCVTFGLQENPKISNDALFQFAFDQWLLADLCEVGVSTLPEVGGEGGGFVTLGGKYAVQLNYLVDISEPCYDQLRNLYNKKLDEADDEIQMRKNLAQHVKKKRMLKLEMSDGRKTVVGMEHSPIAALSTKIPPGTKMLLMGPIRCINKVLFLEPKNVRVLGGEVDTLLITNAFENVLLRALGKELNPDPKTEYEEVVVVEKTRNANYATIPTVPMVYSSPGKPKAISSRQGNDDWEDDMLLGINLEAIEGSAGQKAKPPEQVHTISTLMDDDDADLEIINLPEEEIMNHQVSSTKTSQPSPKAPPKRAPPIRLPSFDGPDDDIDAMEALENEIRAEQRNNCEEPPPTPSTAPQLAKRPRIASPAVVSSQQPSTSSKNFDDKCTVSALFDDDDDSLEAFELRLKSPAIESDDLLSPRYRFQIEGHSLVTVNQINQLPDADRNDRTFVVFGEVMDVFERVRVSGGQWKLGVQISDRSERMLSVRFHTDVISGMVGHDGVAMETMKRDRSEEGLKRLQEILIRFKNNLCELRSFMRVQYDRSGDIPFVTELYEYTAPRQATLKAKVTRERSTAHLLEVLPPDCDIVKR